MNLSETETSAATKSRGERAEPSVAVRTVAEDLARRWTAARRAALVSGGEESRELSEEELVELALLRDRELCLRRVFDHSRQLGLGFRRFYQVDIPLHNLLSLLPRLGVECLKGNWRKVASPPHYQLLRTPCAKKDQCRSIGVFFREATDGLIIGLTSSVHFARHRSHASGDKSCVDVLFVQDARELRFGAIPDTMKQGLEEARRVANIFDSQTEIEFLGVSEGVLFYSIKNSSLSAGVRIKPPLERALARRFPLLRIVDVTPTEVPIQLSKDMT